MSIQSLGSKGRELFNNAHSTDANKPQPAMHKKGLALFKQAYGGNRRRRRSNQDLSDATQPQVGQCWKSAGKALHLRDEPGGREIGKLAAGQVFEERARSVVNNRVWVSYITPIPKVRRVCD